MLWPLTHVLKSYWTQGTNSSNVSSKFKNTLWDRALNTVWLDEHYFPRECLSWVLFPFWCVRSPCTAHRGGLLAQAASFNESIQRILSYHVHVINSKNENLSVVSSLSLKVTANVKTDGLIWGLPFYRYVFSFTAMGPFFPEIYIWYLTLKLQCQGHGHSKN